MSKTRRIIPVNAAMHLISRGNNRQRIFNNDADKLRYYSLMLELKKENDLGVFHYCIMDIHSHLIVWLNEKSRLSKFMQQLSLGYYEYYKKTYGYSGHLWQGRFKSNIVDSDSYLLQCGKYIELNPVRAQIVVLPQDYLFSSYNFYAYGKPDSLLIPNPAYLALSDILETKRRKYIDFVIDSDIINSDRLRKQQFIGSEVFINELEHLYALDKGLRRRGRPKKK